MAAALMKTCFLNPNRCHHSFHHFRQRRIEHSARFPVAFRCQSGNPQSKLFSVFRRIRAVESPAGGREPSKISFWESSSSPKSGLIGWYLTALQARPIATKSVTSALIYSAADVSAQTIVGELEQYDMIRTLRMAGYGMVILGPSLHYWYNFISRVFPKRDLLSTLKKMALGQTVYGPAMTTTFFSVNAALQGETYSEIVARLKRDLLPTVINGIMYWPVCDFVTFKFVPVHLQPLVINSFSYLWTIYITYMASLSKAGAS